MSNSASTKLSRLLTTAKVRTKKNRNITFITRNITEVFLNY